jgi:hypothetical protein
MQVGILLTGLSPTYLYLSRLLSGKSRVTVPSQGLEFQRQLSCTCPELGPIFQNPMSYVVFVLFACLFVFAYVCVCVCVCVCVLSGLN